MSNPWFRMYSEFAIDPKVQMLSEANQRRYIMLLCLRCSNGDVTLQDCEVAFQLRISNEEWATSKAVLVEKKLIDNANSPTAWSKRQYASDSSAARVARHRDGKKRACNVTVTPPDTDTDTDKRKRYWSLDQQKNQKPTFDEFYKLYPKKIKRQEAEKVWKAITLKQSTLIFEDLPARTEKHGQWQDKQYIPAPDVYLRNQRWLDEIIPLKTETPIEPIRKRKII